VAGIDARSEGSPKLDAQALGGRAVIQFNAADGGDALTIAQTVNPLANAIDFSVAVLFRTSSTALQGGAGEWYQNTGLVDANQLAFGRDWGLSINAAGQITAGMTGGLTGNKTSLASPQSGFNDGGTHVAVFTRAGGELTLYVDGQVAATRADADTQPRAVSGFAIGSLLTRSGYYTGEIAEVRMYNGALSSDEASAATANIQAYYNNQPPTAVNDTYAVDEDFPLFFVTPGIGVLANDTDADQDPLTAQLLTPTQHGTINFNADGSFLYDSDPNFNGTDSFTYTASDFRPGGAATVTINVRSVYDPVQPKSDTYMLRPGSTLQVSSLVGLLANDVNPDRATLRTVLAQAPHAGQLTLQPDGGFNYDPQGFVGRTSFTYRVDDGTQLSPPVQVNLAVTSPPQANADSLTTNEDAQLVIFDPALGVLANDIDPEGDPLTVTLVSTTTQGALTLNANGSLVYTPAIDFNGSDSFTYRVSDGFDDSAVVTATIQVNSVNDLPTAQLDGYVGLPDQTLAVPVARGVLANDFDLDGPNLQSILATPAQHGVVELAADGSFVYVPDASFQGTDTFTYRAVDSVDSTGEITVQIGVSPQPLIISEFLASNLSGLTTRVRVKEADRYRGDRLTHDWLELQSQLDFAFDLGGLHLTDQADDLTRWEFPAGTIVEPGGYLLVFASGLDIRDPALDENVRLHTNFSLSSDGEYLAVTSPEGVILDAIVPGYPQQLADISYGVGASGTGFFLTPTPGVANPTESLQGRVPQPVIDQPHGFYIEPVTVTIRSDDAQATVRYTLDGSEPTLTNSLVYSEPITLAQTAVVRSVAFRDGFLPSVSDTRTYLFLADVVTQSLDGKPPAGWPARWGANATDYGMDPDVINNPTWGPQMHEALTQIPSMSIVTNLGHLFDTSTGIYSHPANDGIGWERPASLELINPDGTAGFQQNIGLRIRGGFSRDTGNPKHAFRFFFDSPYGEGWLNYPLFEDEGADSFAKVDLRTTHNYSWAFQNDNRNTFLRDLFSRDLQGEMGQQYTRGRFYHLYLNGQYFGLYQTDERPEANFAASYYGGDPEDYDVIHNDPRQNGATNGNLDAYRRLWDRFMQTNGLGDVNMEDYYRVQGMNRDGSRNPEYERLLDVDNLIDYMIITYYTSDADGPGSKFTRPGLNNYFTIFNRENPDGFKFFEHDSEHSLDTGNAAGANYNMVSPLLNNGRVFPQFNPHWMHEQLANSNSDYLVRFRDRVAKVFADDGVLGNANVFKLIDQRAAQIDKAIIAESARWGDAKRPNSPYTKTDWTRAVGNIKNWVTSRAGGTGRRAEVLTQLAREGWWEPNAPAPVFSQNGGHVDPGFQLTVNLSGNGEIYVTTDGTDPRDSGGGINPNAQRLTAGSTVTIQTGGVVRARNLNGSDWSTVTEARFFVEPLADLDSLRISEIHYHPTDPTESEMAAGFVDADEFEFLELVNISDRTIDLTGTELRQDSADATGTAFRFEDAADTKLAPGARVLVVENLAAFRWRYGHDLPVAGAWTGGLSNAGETLRLATPDGAIHQFAYSDDWYPNTDGGGTSLEIVDAQLPDLAAWGTALAWGVSAQPGGTPGQPGRLPGDVNQDGIFDEADLIAALQAGEYEDSVADNSSFAEGDWNGDGNFTTADLVYVFNLGLYRRPRRG